MYLKLADKICPRKVASVLRPDISEAAIEWDYENVYEWVYVDFPGLSFSLDVTRDHGQSVVDDDKLDLLTDEELENLPSIGPTYIFGFDRTVDAYVNEINEDLVQQVSDALQVGITVYPGRINMGKRDPEPLRQIKPRR